MSIRAAAHIRTRGVATDEWLGIENTVMLVMGPEHRRFLADAGWSKDDARNYLFPRLKEGERPVRIGMPEGILFVAAGGPGFTGPTDTVGAGRLAEGCFHLVIVARGCAWFARGCAALHPWLHSVVPPGLKTPRSRGAATEGSQG